LSLIARIVVAVVAIGWVLHGQDWTALGQVFRRLSLWCFTLSLVTYAATQAIIAFRWRLLLRAQSIYISMGATVRLHFLGLFYNNVMPGSVGGDLLKAWYVTKHTDKRLAGALSVFVDRAIGLVGLVFMAVVTYFLVAHGSLRGPAGSVSGGAGAWLGQHKNLILWIFVGIMAVLVILFVQPYGRARLTRALGQAFHRGVSLLLEVKDAALVYCFKPLTVLWAMLLTFVVQSAPIVTFWLLGRNLGIDVGLTQYFFIFPVMWVVGALPISVAGLGVVEAGTVGLFIHLTGAPRESALALVLCQRLIWVLASLPGGVVHLLGAHLPGELC
jgi:uncharacterized membrane protein YbhN (UPF0104 family)